MLKKRNLFILIPNLEIGGTEGVVLSLVKGLAKSERVVVTFVVLTDFSGISLDKIPQNVNLVFLGCRSVKRSLPKLIKLIRKEKPDILFSNSSHLNLALAICSMILPSKICLVARESTIISENIKKYSYPFLWTFLVKIFYGNFCKIVCQSTYMMEDLITKFHIDKDKMVVIPNPVSLTEIKQKSLENNANVKLKFAKNRVNLISIGRFRSEKKIERLIKAVNMIGREKYKIHLVGDGIEEQKLRALVHNYGMQDIVEFHGIQSNPFPYLKSADALVLSSDYEGSPNVVLEAICLNKPVISTPSIGGLMEIHDNVDCIFLSNRRSAESLGEAIKEAESTNFFQRKFDLSERFIEKHNILRVLNQYEDLFCSFKL